jgi:hypothetical protein
MIDEKYLALFIGLLRYPGIDELEVRDAFLNVLYGTIPNGVHLLCDTPTFCVKLISYVRQCDKSISVALSQATGMEIKNDSEFRALARFVAAGLDSGYEQIEKNCL